MRPPVGLIPAAGVGSRLGLEGSKELAPVADPRSPEGPRRPSISRLLDAMSAASVETAYVILRRGKWDIPETLAERGDRPPSLAYVVTEPTRSIPETIDCARRLVTGREILFGFPDVVFQPADAARQTLDRRRRTGVDVVLALFPSERPDKTDMVEIDGDRVTGFRVKPGPCELQHTWILGAWGDAFTRYLAAYLERTGGAPPPGSRLAELQLSQVLAAALADGLSIGARVFPKGRFIDIGTPEDLERARGGSAAS